MVLDSFQVRTIIVLGQGVALPLLIVATSRVLQGNEGICYFE